MDISELSFSAFLKGFILGSMPVGHLWKPPLAEDLTAPRAGRALCPHSAAAEAWDVAMRHSDAKSRRVSGALRQRALPIMDTATAVENGFPEVPWMESSSMVNPLSLRMLKMKLMGSLAMPASGPHRLIALF